MILRFLGNRRDISLNFFSISFHFFFLCITNWNCIAAAIQHKLNQFSIIRVVSKYNVDLQHTYIGCSFFTEYDFFFVI